MSDIDRPHIIKNKEGRDIEYFISIYGFTKSQLNDWLLANLKNVKNLDKIKTTGFAQKIIEIIKRQKKIDIYEEIVENETLSPGELRRPIFAYMVYQLILNNIDFSALGKIGVYLSFLNLLTKDAKHVHDTTYRINLKEEFEFRNLLHATAALWMYERQQGKQGALKKADICRVLDGENKAETDSQVLVRYKDEGVVEIQFLSHSYFGENENVLHFQHQSFAEILLAEYYLKVFIKYALDEEFDFEEARIKLLLGEPTEQTIQFLKEMLRLLRETAVEKVTDEIIEKRRLLFPLMASLATQKNNRLLCHDIFYGWYKRCKIPENQSEYPLKSLKNWCIGQEEIDKIVHLAKEILESKTNYLMTKADEKTVLYDKEILAIQSNKLRNFPPDIDRWLALLVGNELFNDEEKEKFFNGEIENFEHLFDLIRNWNYAYGASAPSWGIKLFRGIDMRGNTDTTYLNYLNLFGLDFSNSYLNNFNVQYSFLRGINFNNVTFENFDAGFSNLRDSSFLGMNIEPGYFDFALSTITQGIFMPYKICEFIFRGHYTGEMLTNFGSSYCHIGRTFDQQDLVSFYNTLKGILIFGLKNQLFTVDEIKTMFVFESKKVEKEFFKKIDELKKYEVKEKTGDEEKA